MAEINISEISYFLNELPDYDERENKALLDLLRGQRALWDTEEGKNGQRERICAAMILKAEKNSGPDGGRGLCQAADVPERPHCK